MKAERAFLVDIPHVSRIFGYHISGFLPAAVLYAGRIRICLNFGKSIENQSGTMPQIALSVCNIPTHCHQL